MDAKTIATDTEELADNVNLGPKFHVIGGSLGGAFTWSVIKHIPHR
jgi:pimeloyl-ACP methyl ester carboxylesterase